MKFRQALYWPRRGLGGRCGRMPSPSTSPTTSAFTQCRRPGDEPQLLLVCEMLRRRPLHPGRPLWEMWFLTGLPDDRVGFLIRRASRHRRRRCRRGHPRRVPRPRPRPTRDQCAALDTGPGAQHAGAVRGQSAPEARRIPPCADHASDAPDHDAAHPALLAGVRAPSREGRAPRTSVNRRIGSDRRLAVVRGSLDEATRAAHAARDGQRRSATAVAAGYAELFSRRGQPTDGVILRAFVPVSLHQEQPGAAQGNVDAGMLVLLSPASVTTSAVPS